MSFLWDAPVALLIFLGEAIQVKAIEGDALSTDSNFGKRGAHLGIEPIAVHTEVAGRITQPDKAGQQQHRGVPCAEYKSKRPGPRRLEEEGIAEA